jgi:hypothetical protein
MISMSFAFRTKYFCVYFFLILWLFEGTAGFRNHWTKPYRTGAVTSMQHQFRALGGARGLALKNTFYFKYIGFISPQMGGDVRER